MPRTRFASPFAYQTPIGASLNNISSALFAGPGPYEQDKMAAEAEYRRALVDKERNAADIARRVFERQRDPRFHAQSAALLSGVPVENIMADVAYLGGNGGPMPPAVPAGTDINRAREALAAIQLGLADNKSTAGDIAGATGRFQRTRLVGDAASGFRTPTDVAAALFSETGHAPYHTTEAGSGNVLTGATTLNTLGEAKAAERTAAAGNQGAQARQHNADAAQIEDINKYRVGGRYGAPQIAADQESGGIRYTSPIAATALGMAPGARPVDRAITLKPVLNDDGTTTWQRVADAEGAQVGGPPRAAPRATPVRPMTKTESDLIDSAIAGAVGESNVRTIDGQTLTALRSRAAQLALDPTSPYHHNPAGAAEAAVAEVGGLRDTRSGIPLISSRYVANAPQPAAALPTVVPSGPRAASVPQVPPSIAGRLPAVAPGGGGALPPAAAARLREGVVTNFQNGQQWTLQNGRPVQVR